MKRTHASIAALGISLALAGCNETAGGMVASAPPPPEASRQTALALPRGTACANEIDRFQAVVKDDLETGNVAQRVYDQIQREMTRAASACSAGKGREAHSIVASSKASHGYGAG